MMELPRKVLVGQGIIGDLGIFVKDLGAVSRVLVVTGPHVRQKVGRKVEESLSSSGLTATWFVAENSTKEVAEQIAKKANSEIVSYLIGLGGGKAVDLSKLAAFYSG